ncbi:MAG: ATP-dependent DNA ligase, partial [Sulfolobales archaeon]
DIKIKLIAGLLIDAEPIEAKYLVRLIEGRLRLGIGDATVLDALAICYGGSQDYRVIVERAYNIRADLGNVAKTLALGGIESLKTIKPKVGVPIRPMLAERLNEPSEILSKVGGKAIVEFKYDGERAQIHKSGNDVWVFSRRLENITHQYPDAVEAVLSGLKCRECIVEGEIVAIDPSTNELRTFQELMHRKRKHDIHEVVKEFPVRLYLFDVLYVDDKDLTLQPISVRKRYLQDIVIQSESLRLADSTITDDPNELERFFLKSIENGCEGVVVKAMHDQAIYQAGARGWLWIKYKRDYKSEMIDTVDLTVIGAFYGRGRRGGKYGALLMAAYDPDTDTFKSVCKVGSGFTDEDLEKIPSLLQPYIIDHKHPRVDSELEPDVWVVPALVAEVIGAELTLSPLHTCGRGKVKEGVGISIRFPRFLRWRDEKRAEDATTVDELIEMYKAQLRKISEEVTQEQI